jgi:hypothetical protein
VSAGMVSAVGVADAGVSVGGGTVDVGCAATITVGGMMGGVGGAVGSDGPLGRGVLVGVGVGGARRASGK